MKKYLGLFALLVVAKCLFTQTLYMDSLFADITKATFIYDTIDEEILQFDYYLAADAPKETPLLIYVHGGGFSTGKRDDEKIVSFCNKLAYYGYAVASVSYRLTMKDIGFGCDVAAAEKIAAINSASYDVNRAVNYILHHSEGFNINKDKVVLIGSSAGAETVLNMAYVLNDSNLFNSFNYAGVIGMAGAIITLDSIDCSNAIPTQLFHGTGDRLVPYRLAAHHYCYSSDAGYLMLYGSKAIANRLKGLGTAYYFYSIEGGAHDWSWLPLTKAFNEIIDFLYFDVVNVKAIRQTTRTINKIKP